MNPPASEEKPKTEENTPPITPETQASTETGAAQAAPAEESQQGSLDNNDQPTPTESSEDKDSDSKKESKDNPFKKLYKKFDIYFLIFIFIIVVAVVVSYITLQKNKSTKPVTIATQTLDQNALKQINSNDTQVGGTNQTLDVQSNTVFNGDVLVKQGLQVAGSLKVAGSLTLPGITVSGTTDLGQVNATTLTLTGAETVKGQLTVDQGLTVNGVASFSGILNASAITVTSLEVNGDMTFQHHIYTTGSIPKATSTNALGAGGTSSVNGTDTAGNVNVNTGVSPSAGCLVQINFAQAYATTPFVDITPIGQAAGDNVGWYITKSFTGFSICMNHPPADSPMSFDYHVIG
jgi:cytoskeletal protein CcmA (bactofilin family)